jgi:Ser/Thr protein kinase RdoA (MazF antagonist)
MGMGMVHRHWIDSGEFAAPTPLACFPGEGLILMGYCPGESLKPLLFKPLRFSRWSASEDAFKKLEKHLAQIARLLSSFQQIKREEQPDLSPRRVLRRYETAARSDLRLSREMGLPGSLIERGNETLGKVLREETDGVALCFQHSDFAPWNLLIGERIFLLDFQCFTPGAPEYDLSFFLAALTLLLRYRWVDPLRVLSLKEAFLRRYRSHGSFSESLFRALQIAHLAYFFRVIASRDPVFWWKRIYIERPVPFFRRALEEVMSSGR